MAIINHQGEDNLWGWIMKENNQRWVKMKGNGILLKETHTYEWNPNIEQEGVFLLEGGWGFR